VLGGELGATVNCKVELDALVPGVIVVGESEQLTPVGVEHFNAIALLNPPVAEALTVREVEPPGETDTV
jgi:hypothetical protein